jgi:hypothetical protein
MLSLLRCCSEEVRALLAAAQGVCKFSWSKEHSGVRVCALDVRAVLTVTTVVYKNRCWAKLSWEEEAPEKLI